MNRLTTAKLLARDARCANIAARLSSRRSTGRGVATIRAAAAAAGPEPDKLQSTSALSSNITTTPTKSYAHLWPEVSWNRYHIQVLFIDRTDTVRARLAAGLFERCAEWNGYGRALYPWTCGMTVGGPRDVHAISKLTALMRGATSLEILPRYFTRPAEPFELEDLDRYDLVMALDSQILEEVRQRVVLEHPAGPDREYYLQKTCLLTTFSHYESDAVLTRKGGFALLPSQLAFLLRTGAGGIQASKSVVDIASPDLSGPDGDAQWEAAAATLTLATAGLVKYLIDAYPENLPHWDPVD